jgi:hypothetical protein
VFSTGEVLLLLLTQYTKILSPEMLLLISGLLLLLFLLR